MMEEGFMDCLCKFGAQQDTTFFRGSSVRGTLIGGKTRFVDKAKDAMRMLGLWKGSWDDQF